MREITRTFIAIPVPESLGTKLARLQTELSPAIPGCRWAAGAPYHVTLAFLGDVQNRDLNELCLAVAAAVEPFERIELRLEGIGCFPGPGKPRVVWAGVNAAQPVPLVNLRAAVVRAATQVGYQPDDPRFHPHITLGRIPMERGRGSDLTEMVERKRIWSGGGFSVAEIVTYAATLQRGGVVYAPLGRARLKGRKPKSSH